MKRRLRVSGDVRDDALEDQRLVRRCAHVSIEILELDLLPPEVVAETEELALLILFAFFVFKGVRLNALPHLGGVFIEDTSHLAVDGVNDGWKKFQ